MQILEHAIKRAGGVGALALAIGAGGANTVSNWRQRGRVPKGWLAVLQMKYGDQEAPNAELACTSTHQPPDRFVSF